ncbi:zinc finger CCCH domain-containing protein 37-like isoform X1 [Salvia splendens]|uniref:zinc finger CCCH domain-containing protein 37-like isoform X1 n=1 Tax=Salvia splendens TaxID=180675 RepID=UPI001C25CCF7|nr:zinc finger CCCH domain-containing protein 37-like isoform X1 [Salvia splendens]
MSNHLYGYISTTYGGGAGNSRSAADAYTPSDTSLLATSSRYLAADQLSSSSSLSSSSLLYNPESYSRIPALPSTTSLYSYRPPGVDLAAAAVPTDPLYAGVKRTSAESPYHQTLLGAYNKIGQTDAWYSSNPLAKRTRYESTGHFPIYPQRPGEKDCAFYMQTRTCKFGESCKFDHPVWVPEGGIPDWKEIPLVPSEALPSRPGETDCPFFLKTQKCKFGIRCKFNHPKDSIQPAFQGAPEDSDVSALPERPSEPTCSFFVKTGKCKFGSTCKFHHPNSVQIQSIVEENINGQLGENKAVQTSFAPALLHNSKGLPIRPGEEDCPFYLRTGSCKYGTTCRYSHPDRYVINPQAAIASSLLTSPSARYGLGVAAPAASLLPNFDPRLSQTMVGLTATIFPQRPGQQECDYYMKKGICKYGNNCKFHHPIDRSAPTASATGSPQQNVKLTLAGLPRREGAINCPYYMKTGACKYGATCKFDHPPPGEVMAAAMATASAVGEGKQNGDV